MRHILFKIAHVNQFLFGEGAMHFLSVLKASFKHVPAFALQSSVTIHTISGQAFVLRLKAKCAQA